MESNFAAKKFYNFDKQVNHWEEFVPGADVIKFFTVVSYDFS